VRAFIVATTLRAIETEPSALGGTAAPPPVVLRVVLVDEPPERQREHTVEREPGARRR